MAQLYCCFNVKKKWVRLLPTILLLGLIIVRFVWLLGSDGWGSDAFVRFAIYTAFYLVVCGITWGGWWISKRWFKEEIELAELCSLLMETLMGYEYGFIVDGKKYKPDMSRFDEEYYQLSKTVYLVQDPLVTMKEKIGTCVDAVVVMKYLLDEKKVPNKIWLLYNKVKNKVHTILTFEAGGEIVYLELTPQSTKECYGHALMYADENELIQSYVEKGYDISDVTDRVVVGEQPVFLLEKLK